MDSGKADTSKLTGYSDNQYVVDDDVASGVYEGIIIALEPGSVNSPQTFGTNHVFDPTQSWVFHMEFVLGGLTNASNAQELFSIVQNIGNIPAFAIIARGYNLLFYIMDSKTNSMKSIPITTKLESGQEYFIDMMYDATSGVLMGGINNNKTIDTPISPKKVNADLVGLNGYIQGYNEHSIHYSIIYLQQGING